MSEVSNITANNNDSPGLAVVIGSHGGIGGAIRQALDAGGSYGRVLGLSRNGPDALDIMDEDNVRRATAMIAETGLPVRLVVLATGFLHNDDFAPEKSFTALDPAHMAHAYAVNTIGPALVMKHLLPLLPRQKRSVFAALSARVGSISDNRLGGWHSYRASKAALNQMIRTCAIELKRSHRNAVCAAIHPGTVDTGLSAPFARRGLQVRAPGVAAQEILSVLNGLTPADSGGFFDHKGQAIDW